MTFVKLSINNYLFKSLCEEKVYLNQKRIIFKEPDEYNGCKFMKKHK